MRAGRVCERCRVRHLRCVVDDGAPACQKCLQNKTACRYTQKYRFQNVPYVNTASGHTQVRTSLAHRKDQVWLPSSHPARFILEDGSGEDDGVEDLELAEEDLAETATSFQHDILTNQHTSQGGVVNDDPSSLSALPTTQSWHEQRDSNGGDTDFTVSHVESPLALRNADAQTPQRITSVVDFPSPASILELSRRYEEPTNDTPFSADSPGLIRAFQSSILPSPGGLAPLTTLSYREVKLLHHFVEVISPWIDACDLSRHFAIHLPKRALGSAMVRCSILALSSRHHAIVTSDTDHEASFYHGQCLRLLIEALPSSNTYDADLVASVVLLRVYEEFEASADTYLHAHGIGRLLAAIPTFAHSGGMAEAACWLSLRQNIVVSMVTRQPPSTCLEYYDYSSVIHFQDDGACANVIVLLVAKILRLAYDPAASPDDWVTLSASVDKWNNRRQDLFEPMFAQQAGNDMSPFPIICMANAPQVAAMQHYHICKMFLALYMPIEGGAAGFISEKKRRRTERNVTEHLNQMMGLACSNGFGDQAKLNAHHVIYAYGYYISGEAKRKHTLSLLEFVQREIGWKTSHTHDRLVRQWRELDELDC